MNLDAATIVAVGLPVIGLAVAWGGLSIRVRQVERDVAKIDPLATQVTTIDAKVETARKDQGFRLGNLEADTAVLKGKVEVVQTGFAAAISALMRERKSTKAHGTPLAGDRDK